MAKFSPKIEIINHFDNLINRVDIDIDICLSKYNNDHNLSLLLTSSESDRKKFSNKDDHFGIEFFSTFIPSKTLDLWSESTKVIDYLNQIRMRTIEELKKAQEDTLKYYKFNSLQFKNELTNETNLDELKSFLFAEKFQFQIEF